MSGRRALEVGFLTAVALAAAGTQAVAGSEANEARKKAERVASYVCLAETVAKVGMEVSGMLAKHPFDRALATYARELGKLHESFYAKLTPPEGAEELHKKFKEAITSFTKAAEAHCAADYAAARKWRDESFRDFLKSLGELAKLQKEGLVPSTGLPPPKGN